MRDGTGKLVRTKAPSAIAWSMRSVFAQQSPRCPDAAGVAILGLIGFAKQDAGWFILQFRRRENVDDVFRFVAGLQIALDQHLQIAGNGSMFSDGDMLDTIPDIAPEAHRDARKWLGGSVAHRVCAHHFDAKGKNGVPRGRCRIRRPG